jgi:hypothetical protein
MKNYHQNAQLYFNEWSIPLALEQLLKRLIISSPVAEKLSVRASLSAGEIEFLINVSLRLISGVTISSNSLKEAMSIFRKLFNPFESSADNSWIRE